MSIVATANVPKSGRLLVEQALQDILPHGVTTGGREPLNAQEVEISRPIPLYRLSLDRFHKTRAPQAAEQIGWRYVVKIEDDRFGTADLNGVQADQVSFSSFSDSSNADLFVEALHIAQLEAERSPWKCEIRSLDMPSLYIAAVWVASEQSVFIPYIAPNAFPTKALVVDHHFVENLVVAAESKKAAESRNAKPP